ncbi:serine-rich adhesin for platelets-like [Heterodontus francisci]|uniref:serine-rich adhesin for platelets-like n=1 Tax=Heterodontus francisci TaxID=7792 RepID=UPI00355B4904
MKKSAFFYKPQALCCLCLVFLLPVIATEKWCNNPDNFKWLTEKLQEEINNLNDNLLPSMVKYNVFTDVNSAELTDRCFIIVTAQQLNNTLLLLMSHFKTSSSNYFQAQTVVNDLNKLYNACSDENSHRCLKPDTKVVTACKSDLFAYFQAVLNQYKYIFDQCKSKKQSTEQSEDYLFFLKASNTSISSNCCLIDLHNESQSSNFYTSASTHPSYKVSTPQPFCSLMSPVQTVMDYKLTSNAGVGSTATSVGTGDNNTSAATNKSALFESISTDGPHHSDGNLTQTEVSKSGTVPDILSASSSAPSHSQTVSTSTGATGAASPHEDKQHMNSQKYLYPFIGTLIALALVLCATIYLYSRLRNLQKRYWREVFRAPDTEASGSFLLTEV